LFRYHWVNVVMYTVQYICVNDKIITSTQKLSSLFFTHVTKYPHRRQE